VSLFLLDAAVSLDRRRAIVAKSNIECAISRACQRSKPTNRIFIDASRQSPNFPTNSLIYSKPDMLSHNGELTASDELYR